MGLLDPKSRIMDVVLTDLGRRAMARGDFSVEHYSLTDAGICYGRDLASGSVDLAARVYAECASDLPQDTISLLTDPSRQVDGVRSSELSPTTAVYGGRLLEGTLALSGSDFAETIGAVVSSSLGNLRNNSVLGSVDEFYGDDDFQLAPSRATFALTEPHNPRQTVSVNALESLYQDPLLSHVPNFMYLPPVNKPTDPSAQPSLLGNYSSNGGDVTFTGDDLIAEMDEARRAGRVKTFRFDPSPRENNVHLQFFEQGPSALKKLDVVDFGTIRGRRGPTRVLFLGKTLVDDNGSETFVRLFTVTLD